MDNLGTVRKEYWTTNSFRMILREAVKNRPEAQSFLPNDTSRNTEIQIEEWKSKSAEKRGFDLCFQFITGHSPEDLT